MLTKLLIVRFLLEDGHILDVHMTEKEARRYVAAWGDDQLSQGRLRGTDAANDRVWAVDPARIQSIFTIDQEQLLKEQAEMMKRQQQQGQQGQPTAGTRRLDFPQSGN